MYSSLYFVMVFGGPVIRDFSSARPRSVKQNALVSTHPRSKYRAPMVRSNSLNLSTPFSLFQPAFGVLLWTRRERRGKRLARPLLENCLEAEVFRRFFLVRPTRGSAVDENGTGPEPHARAMRLLQFR